MEALLNLFLLENLANIEERHRERIYRRTLRDSNDPFQLSEVRFMKTFRLSRDLARTLIQKLRPHLGMPRRRTALSVEIKVLYALAFFASGSYQRCVGENLNLVVDQSVISRIIKEVTDVMTDNMLHAEIKFPRTTAEFAGVKEQFYAKFRLPGVIGAIDCTHVAIVAPPSEDLVRPGLAYYNRKGFYSLNVQVICDANLKIINCNATFPGSSHDSAIWSLCAVKRFLEGKYRNNEITSSWLIGDAGYPLQPWLFTPVDNADAESPEGRYTKAHISARNVVERCFGALKQRFRCLLKHRTLHYDPVRAGKIVYACCILHNMCMNANLPLPDLEEVERPGNGDNPIRNPPADPQNILIEGRRVRAELIRNSFM